MAKAKTKGGVNRDALGRFVARVEILFDARKATNEELGEIYAEIKQAGLDPETVRVMVREKALDPQIRQDQYALRDDYRRALGLFLDTPLGRAMEPPIEDVEEDAAPVDGEGAVMADSETRVQNRASEDKPVRKRPQRKFAQQLVHPPRRERKKAPTALDRARAHLGEPVGSA